jgi:hypothetical protein
MLAEVALRVELRRDYNFTYFAFADDDTVLECKPQSCSDPWNRYFDYIFHVLPLTGSPGIALRIDNQPALDKFKRLGLDVSSASGHHKQYILAETYDAFLNTYTRRSLPHILSYPVLAAARLNGSTLRTYNSVGFNMSIERRL